MATLQLTDVAPIVSVEVYEVNGANPRVVNSFEQPDAVTVQERLLDGQGQSVAYTFPAHSLTLLRLHIM